MSKPQFFELFVPARPGSGERREHLRYNLNDPRDMMLYHALIKACTQPWRSETNLVDWQEDFSQENGNYQNICLGCRVYFKGHKRRVFCWMCGRKKKS